MLKVLVGLLLSAQAYACPNLTGEFTCKSQDGTEVIKISQEVRDGVTVFNYNGSEILANNEAMPFPDDDSIREGTFRTWCEEANADLVFSQLLGKYYDHGRYFGDLELNLTLSLTENNLKQVTKGTLKSGTRVYPIESETICERNN